MTKLVLFIAVAIVMLAAVIPAISAANEVATKRTTQMEEIENLFNQ